ncbi:MAG: hypothetical protein ABIE22_03015, partial [archaeon]
DSILMQGKEGLGRINCGNLGYGVNLIFWGLESGSTKVLDYVRKGYTQEDIIRAAEIINSSPVEASVMVMPGLGGARYYEEHLRETAKVLGIIKPKFITFMGLNAHPDSLYARIMAEEQRLGINRNLKDDEKAMQMIQMIEEMPGFETTIGCFSNEIDKVGHNPLEFRGNTSEKIKDSTDKRDVVINSMCDFSIRWDARFDSINPEFPHLAHLQPLLEVSV